MLARLRLQGVGPSEELGPVELGEGVNLLTGDNGLGKSFLLDVAWWALTGAWPARPAWPRPGVASREPLIEAEVRGKTATAAVSAHYELAEERWVLAKGRPPMPGLVLYFRVDGRFSLWDPAQHYWRRNRARNVDHAERPEPLQLLPDELWNAVTSSDGRTLCRGLIEDWVTWQQTRSPEHDALCRVLDCLSPSEAEKLVPGPPMRVWLDDVRLHPTLNLP
ncbi:MAG: AAA family ATPase [Polyangiaceae bacterium]